MDTLLTASSLLPFVIGVLVGGITYFFICKNQNSTPTVSIANNLITTNKALQMIEDYSCDGDDTVSGHLDLSVLLTYINQVTTQCSSIGLPLSGLEYFFAKYKGDPINDNRHTIVIYPTYKNAANRHIPFDPYVSTSAIPVTVADLRSVNVANRTDSSRYDNKVVLDKSNMSPPR